MADIPGYTKKNPLALVWELLNSERGDLGVILTYQLGVGILALTIPIGVQTVVNSIAFTQLFQPVVVLAVAVLVAQGMAAIFRCLQIIVVEGLQRRLFANLSMELAFRLPRMTRQYPARFPEMVNRFFDVVTVKKSLSMLAIEGSSLALQMIIGLILLAFYHPMLFAFDIILVLCIVFVVFVMGKGALSTSIETSKWKYQVAAWLEEVASKSIAFSSKSARFFALQRADEIVDSYLDAREKHFRVVYRQMIGFLSLQAIANTVLLCLGVWLVMQNQLSVGQLVAAEIVVSGVLYSFSRFQKHLTSFYDLVAALDKISFLMDLPLERGGQQLPRLEKGMSIEMKEVLFRSRSSQRSIGPLSLKLAPGSKIAVHGSNGSGKSTLVDMLFGLKSPTSGVILLNGTDSRLLAPELLREQVTLLRGAEVVHGTIAKNVRLGCPKVSLERISEVLGQVGLIDDVLRLPQGIETVLNEDGSPLSVGQTKLLMLARCIVGSPTLLLIDQTIDGLDDRSKAIALDLVFSKNAPWTVIVTSQHPEVESRCDRILNLDLINEK
jgi:putative ABC transport system ATP-binding protein